MWFAPLFKAETWRHFWIAIRRANRDARARRFLIGVIALIFCAIYFFILIGGFVFSSVNNKDFLAIAGIFGVCAISVFAIHKWGERREAKAAPPAVGIALVRQMHKEAFFLAILLTRAGSERMMEKEFPPEIEVITRRVQREKIVELGLWDELPEAMKSLLLLPDGHWTEEQKSRAESCWEYLSVLRWVLRFDDSLRPLDRRPSYEFAKTREIINGYADWSPGDTLAPWDLRPARDQAIRHFGRLWIEAVARGLVKDGVEPDQRAEALRIKTDIDSDGSSTDLLIEAQTVSELPDPDLWFLLRTAYWRKEILKYLVPWLSGEVPLLSLQALWVERLSS
jgi:hypothetical protein